MLCPNCGTANPDESRFCMRCGHALSEPSTHPIPSVMPVQLSKADWRLFSAALRGRLGKLIERADLWSGVLSLIGTVLAIFVSIASESLLSNVSLLSPIILTIVATTLTLLVTFSALIPMTMGVFKGRAIQRELKRTRLLEKERDFFVKVSEDVSMLLNKGGEQHAN